jgi:single-stranded-DNA-specific exonuclease
MAKRWRIHPHDPARVMALERAAGIPAVVAQLLICRGMTDARAARQFLQPKLSGLHDPELLPGCAQAAELLNQAIARGQRIVVYGDYDVDGVTGTALLYSCLRLLGANVGYYIPHRIDEGYGLHEDAVRTLAAEKAELIVTVDCGITSFHQVELARQLAAEVIVTDHHQPAERLPLAAAVIHPRLPGGGYPFGQLSGAGVALKLAWALCRRASGAARVAEPMKDFLLQAVGMAALGTVADVVPLLDENRVLVHHGLSAIAERPTLGLSALLQITGLADKKRLDAEDLGFTLAPRLNAAGRLCQAQLAVELLTTDRAQRALELAQYLDQLNATRQTLERSVYLSAHKQLKEQCDPQQEPAIVLADRDWHPGVIGIVAGRLAEKYHRPVILIAWDPLGVRPGIGSGRSVPGFDLQAALQSCSELLISHGGHPAAAGLKIAEDKFAAFRAAFCEAAERQLGAERLAAELEIDAEAPLCAFTLEAVRQIERLGPFGHGNRRPVLCSTGVTLAEPPKLMGTNGYHLSVRLAQHGVKLRAIAFGAAEWAEQLACQQRIDVAFQPMINTFAGRQSVELRLIDWKPASPAASAACG